MNSTKASGIHDDGFRDRPVAGEGKARIQVIPYTAREPKAKNTILTYYIIITGNANANLKIYAVHSVNVIPPNSLMSFGQL